MAISIEEEKNKERSSFVLDRTSRILLIAVVVLIVAYGLLFLYKIFISSNIKSTQLKIQEVNKRRDVALEKEMKSTIEKFQKINNLLSSHKNARGIFNLLEQNIYPGVTISSFEANLKENSLSFNISSATPQNLAIQIAAFKQAKLPDGQNAVSSVEVGNFSISGENVVTLHIKLIFNPAIIKF